MPGQASSARVGAFPQETEAYLGSGSPGVLRNSGLVDVTGHLCLVHLDQVGVEGVVGTAWARLCIGNLACLVAGPSASSAEGRIG